MKRPPRILCIGGHDPTGGAGIQADIETITALGGQALSLVTALTAQDTHDVASLLPTPADFFSAAAGRLLHDIAPDAIKIGLIGSAALIPPLVRILRGFHGPVVLDPVLAAGGGFDLGAVRLVEAMREQLLPLVTLATPNRAEARRLAARIDAAQAARALIHAGAGAVLLTGADEAEGDVVTNHLYLGDRDPHAFQWPRLPQRYHGSGCTLSSACALYLATGDDPVTAVDRAQSFTATALRAATKPGGGQWLPWRRG